MFQYSTNIPVIRIILILSVISFYNTIFGERIRYISTERPCVSYYNRKYLTFVNLTCQRYSRDNPFYYVGLHFNVLIPFGNNVLVDFFFYEFLSNVYKRSFVQMNFGWCDLIHKDPFFGAAMKQGKLDQPCPYAAGEYHLYNMTIPLEQVPRTFPFKKGRIYANLTILTGAKGRVVEPFATGHIDMEVKEFNKKSKKIT